MGRKKGRFLIVNRTTFPTPAIRTFLEAGSVGLKLPIGQIRVSVDIKTSWGKSRHSVAHRIAYGLAGRIHLTVPRPHGRFIYAGEEPKGYLLKRSMSQAESVLYECAHELAHLRVDGIPYVNAENRVKEERAADEHAFRIFEQVVGSSPRGASPA